MLVHMHQLLTIKQMYEADRLAIAGEGAGEVSGIDLMENAGAAIAKIALERWPKAHNVVVFCGPGNNGGDGFVVARLLAGQGLCVRLINVLADVPLSGDAAIAAKRYDGVVETLPDDWLASDRRASNRRVCTRLACDRLVCDLVIDAMFGAGLSRPLAGVVAEIVDSINQCDAPVLSVDMPSGIDGDSGAVCGCALKADVTVTFFRRKPGHLQMPGRGFCGCLRVVDIGIEDQVLETIKPQNFANEPALWSKKLPISTLDQHKYNRGHVLAVSGGHAKTGAGRLAARGALRAGAGLVSVASPPDALDENAAHLTAIMIKVFGNSRDLAAILDDKRLNSVVIGPGLGLGKNTQKCVEAVLSSGAKTVIDADGLTGFTQQPETTQALFSAIKAMPNRDVVLTPHGGEFGRLFGNISGSKIEQAAKAAKTSGATIVYKGADTVIAAPDPPYAIAINYNAPASLATAGSGDVLAGIIAGLMGQGMSGFDAGCAGVWMHGHAARLFGPGLIAEDLPEMLPKVWAELLKT